MFFPATPPYAHPQRAVPLHTVFTLAEHGGDAVLALPAVLPWGAGGWKELGTLTPHCFTCVALSALENLTGMKLG